MAAEKRLAAPHRGPDLAGGDLSIEEKYDEVRQLINIGKEKGYLLYDEVNELLPSEITSSDELDDLFNTFGSAGIEVIDSDQKYLRDDVKPIDRTQEGAEELELDLTPGALDKTNDPVRMYLREMGTVPLLTREGEVEIARRIERGKLNVFKALSRSPIVIQEMFALREDLAKGERSDKKVVVFNDDELTEEKVQERLRDVIATIDEMERLNKRLVQLKAKRESIPRTKRPRDHRRYVIAEGRHRVLISKLFRSIEVTHAERKRLIERIRQAVEEIKPLERDVNRLERRLEATRNNGNKDVKKELRQYKTRLSELEEQHQTAAVGLKRTLQTIINGEREAEAAKRELIEANLRL